ncbi:MAG: molecular chaperone GrpE [Solirubrobacteraceae bacterium]|nr:molecular chaperone GrpE [Solirubrobacteraceae bacterium]
MSRDPQTADAPEPVTGSGDPSAPDTEKKDRFSSGADGSPEPQPGPSVPAGEPEAPVGPATTPADEEQEPETSSADLDVAALTAKAAKAEEYLDLAQRTRAEFENYRKRAVREAAAAQERGVNKLALELLPAIDNLDRALAHAAGTDSENGDASLLHGIRHVHSDVLAALKRAGIEPFSPQGEAFDPQYHEAVAQQPLEGAEPGTVVEVYQRGYRRGESVLRPARVVVAG